MHNSYKREGAGFMLLTVLLLALPALAEHVWLVSQFNSYFGARFIQDTLFSVMFCGLLVLNCRWRLLRLFSWPVSLLLYMLWLGLVISEGVSYYLQSDTFNDRFFAHLNPGNLSTGLKAFPFMIGGGGVLLLMMLGIVSWLLIRQIHSRPGAAPSLSKTGRAGVLLIAVVLCFILDSAPHRLASYFQRYEQSFVAAASPVAHKVFKKIDAHPVGRDRLMASPGRNVVIIYMESLERMFLDPKAFPGLTPNLDRLRSQGLDFSGFETFSGATYTIAGMFSSQCGLPLFSSPFEAFDFSASNNNDKTTFHGQLVCLGDVLHAAGYEQVYMGGAPISFSNKGLFYKLHGYDEALGLNGLEKGADGRLPQEGWGLYDRDLFNLALARYHKLSRSGKPFNLAMITLDTHPPHGRPSPGCPIYKPSPNRVLQGIHCTDYLVAHFIRQLKKDPAWKNTIVMVMSDHLAMRNDAEKLYPKGYHRQPLLFFLNAGQGERKMRMYHMDIAPTLLSLMGVRTNATFVAGADRSKKGAESNPIVDNQVTDSVLRKVLWSTNGEHFELCKSNRLLGWAADEKAFQMGGKLLHMANNGEQQVSPHGDQVLTFLVNKHHASLLMVHRDALSKVLAGRGAASALMIRPLYPIGHEQSLFSVDWLGRNGAIAHLGLVKRLQGLTIGFSQCGKLLNAADSAPPGKSLDYRRAFKMQSAPRYVRLEERRKGVDFSDSESASRYRDDVGWLPAHKWGSWTIGHWSSLSLSLSDDECRRGGRLSFYVHPYLPASRPELDVHVVVDGRQVETWRFARGEGPDQTRVLAVPPGSCRLGLRFEFTRPGAAVGPPYPAGEDQRRIQLDFVRMKFEQSGS